MTTESQAKAAECAQEARKQAALLAPGRFATRSEQSSSSTRPKSRTR